MSIRWIQENKEAPTCDEESSDIDDSCSNDSYDTDLSFHEDDKEKKIGDDQRKRESCDNDNTSNYITYESHVRKPPPCVIWDPRKPVENPIYGSLKIKLFCRTGYHLAIMPSGRVRGLSSSNDVHANLQVTSTSYGVVRIGSVETGFYLAFNKKGRLYGESNMNKENTEWEQWSMGSYDAFRSRKFANEGWWIGIKKNGRAKPGPNTSWGQKAIQFLAVKQD